MIAGATPRKGIVHTFAFQAEVFSAGVLIITALILFAATKIRKPLTLPRLRRTTIEGARIAILTIHILLTAITIDVIPTRSSHRIAHINCAGVRIITLDIGIC